MSCWRRAQLKEVNWSLLWLLPSPINSLVYTKLILLGLCGIANKRRRPVGDDERHCHHQCSRCDDVSSKKYQGSGSLTDSCENHPQADMNSIPIGNPR